MAWFGKSEAGVDASRLTTAIDPRSAVAEAYRTLRTNLEFSSIDRPLRSIVVTSSGPEEGKTTVLANLAVALAEAGKRVIAVDCDFRSPSLHNIVGGPREPGFTNVILGEELEAALHPTAIQGLQLMPSGPIPPNPAEVIASARLEQVLESLGKQADMILIDTPPIGLVADAAQLAARTDGVLLVLRAGRSRREAAQRAKRQLEQVHAHILGVVLNDVRGSDGAAWFSRR